MSSGPADKLPLISQLFALFCDLRVPTLGKFINEGLEELDLFEFGNAPVQLIENPCNRIITI